MEILCTWADVDYIIAHKLDIIDPNGYTIAYVRFMNLTLMEIALMKEGGRYKYKRV